MIRQISSKSIYSVLKSCSAKCQSVLVAEKIRQSSSNEEKSHNAIKSSALLDSFGRFHDYLRISLTDRCNLRCRYCMPDEGYEQYARPEILGKEEILTLVKFFAKHGVSKVRLTGGEPTIRQDLKAIVGSISKIDGIKKLALTSNGLTLAKQLMELKQLGLTHLNISLDTLVEPKFDFITRRKGWKRVWNAIELAETLFPIVKINCVVMRGFNDDEICDFVKLTKNRNLDIRFIEYMPFGGNKWNSKKLVSYHEMKNILENHYGPLKPLPIEANHTSKGYQVPGFQGAIGFISSMSNHFCGTCSRLRITADGCLKVCLHGNSEVSLKDALQSGASEETLRNLVTQAIKRKKKQHAGMFNLAALPNRPMVQIGG